MQIVYSCQSRQPQMNKNILLWWIGWSDKGLFSHVHKAFHACHHTVHELFLLFATILYAFMYILLILRVVHSLSDSLQSYHYANNLGCRHIKKIALKNYRYIQLHTCSISWKEDNSVWYIILMYKGLFSQLNCKWEHDNQRHWLYRELTTDTQSI